MSNRCRHIGTTHGDSHLVEGDCFGVYEGNLLGDPEDKVDAPFGDLLLQNNLGEFNPDLPCVVIPNAQVRNLRAALQNYLNSKETGYNDPEHVTHPNRFRAFNPPQWFKDSDWMELDVIEAYMQSLEWYVGRLTNQELSQHLQMAADLNKRNETDGWGVERLKLDVLMTCEADVLIPVIQAEMTYRKGVDDSLKTNGGSNGS